MGRSPCCAKEGLNRGAWSSIEDKTLTDFINTHGEGRWRSLPKRAGLKRCGKSCRLRWLNYLRPDIVRGNISQDEEELIIRLHKLLGNRWSLIAGRLPGRTDNEIKNYWNTNLCKRLSNPISSPVTKHKKPNPSPSSTSIIIPPPPPVTAIKTKAMRFSSKAPIFNKYQPPPTQDQENINDDSTTIIINNNNNNPSTTTTTAFHFSPPDSVDNFGFLPPDDIAAAAVGTDLMLDMEQLADFRFSDLFVNDFASDFSLINHFGLDFPNTTPNYVVEDCNLELNWVLD